MPRNEAVEFFKSLGEIYKAEIIASIPEKEEISLYGQGNWVDLCRGPHVPSTGKLKAFKLMKVAGAYWRGDSRNEMLQRIYGTAWADKKQLDEYLHRLEEAEKRDHRRIGRELDLFHLQEEAPGAVFWHPQGLARSSRRSSPTCASGNREAGFEEVNAPELMDVSLWQQSGHLEKFGENMFLTKTPDERVYAIKPMNCPGHVQIFKQGMRSYRDLPIRFAEFGKVHRYEPSGALHGLMRVRAFTQDDAHIFITEEQITEESVHNIQLLLSIYRDFGFDDVRVKFADRPPKRVGDDEVWDTRGDRPQGGHPGRRRRVHPEPGGGRLLRPEARVRAEGRHRAGLAVRHPAGGPEHARPPGRPLHRRARARSARPVMLHRAIFGSLERFFAILLEHHAGQPAGLARAGAGGGHDDHRPAGRLRQRELQKR